MKRKNGGFRTLVFRQKLTGILFISPWLVGVTVFFLVPLVLTSLYIFGNVSVSSQGVDFTFTGLNTIKEVFFNDPQNFRMVIESVGSSVYTVLLVLIFSLFVAVLLKQKFHGRAVVRALFALPVIVSSGILLMVFKEDLFAQSIASDPATVFQSSALQQMLLDIGISMRIVTAVTGFVDNIMDVIWKSGVQILLFLAGLQSVPPSLYEVAFVEGSTSWLSFWKITFPLLFPYVILNTVYSIIDFFTFYDNPIIQKTTSLFLENSFSKASALSIAYFLLILVLVGTVMLISSRNANYIEK